MATADVCLGRACKRLCFATHVDDTVPDMIGCRTQTPEKSKRTVSLPSCRPCVSETVVTDTPYDAVFENVDLVRSILLSVPEFSVEDFVTLGRVSKTFRAGIRLDNVLLMRAAHSRPYLNKGTLCGLFGLLYEEANSIPRRVRHFSNGRGREYLYDNDGIEKAWFTVGSMRSFASRKRRDRVFSTFYEEQRRKRKRRYGGFLF